MPFVEYSANRHRELGSQGRKGMQATQKSLRTLQCLYYLRLVSLHPITLFSQRTLCQYFTIYTHRLWKSLQLFKKVPSQPIASGSQSGLLNQRPQTQLETYLRMILYCFLHTNTEKVSKYSYIHLDLGTLLCTHGWIRRVQCLEYTDRAL